MAGAVIERSTWKLTLCPPKTPVSGMGIGPKGPIFLRLRLFLIGKTLVFD